MAGLVLVRHAAATGQEPLAPLTDDGHRQALALAELLVPLDVQRVISSPFLRAIDTAAPLGRRLALSVETDVRLVERVLSTRPLPDWREHLRRSFDDHDYCLAGGESSRTAQARGLAVLHAARTPAGSCVVVTHGNLLALLLRSLDPTVGFEAWSALSNPDAFLVEEGEDGPSTFHRLWN